MGQFAASRNHGLRLQAERQRLVHGRSPVDLRSVGCQKLNQFVTRHQEELHELRTMLCAHLPKAITIWVKIHEGISKPTKEVRRFGQVESYRPVSIDSAVEKLDAYVPGIQLVIIDTRIDEDRSIEGQLPEGRRVHHRKMYPQQIAKSALFRVESVSGQHGRLLGIDAG
jgi:hypothetical protein